jgi:hypothetical protein
LLKGKPAMTLLETKKPPKSRKIELLLETEKEENK